MTPRAAVLTVSDLAARGEREDTAGPAVAEMLTAAGFEVTERAVAPDEPREIAARLVEWTEAGLVLVITTGGTGIGPRDRTPEATQSVVDFLIPGIPEAMRAAYVDVLPQAMLSRSVAGVRGRTLIINLPGSEKAARENLGVVLPALGHACALLADAAVEVAAEHRAVQQDAPPDAGREAGGA